LIALAFKAFFISTTFLNNLIKKLRCAESVYGIL